MSDKKAVVFKSCPVVYIQDSQTHSVLEGYAFQNRRTGRRFVFNDRWELDVNRGENLDLIPKHLTLGDEKQMCYMVGPSWKVQHLSQQDAIDEARRKTFEVLTDMLPPGTEINIRIKLPEPPMLAIDPKTSMVQMLDRQAKGGADV